jgi:2-polyprenyl-6-methoxyphenol hydroxylase-like FAD-dependent oxidoreductase
MLANELGRRGIAVVLVDQNPGTTLNAAANATQARTMEHFRRLGFADEVRSLGLPPDFPTDVAYFTRFALHEPESVVTSWRASREEGSEKRASSWRAKRVK